MTVVKSTIGGFYFHFVDPLLPVGQPSLEFALEEIKAHAFCDVLCQ